MNIGEICTRSVIVVERGSSIQEAAQLMRQHHVGAVVIVEDHQGIKVPMGMLTDRDLVMEVLALDIDHTGLTVGDIARPEIAKAHENTSLLEAIRFMGSKGVRRLPVVDDSGALIGILALDDVLALLADELRTLANVVAQEQKTETTRRR